MIANARTVAYWRDRAAGRMSYYLREAATVQALIRRAHGAAQRQIMADIERIRHRYATDFGLSEDEVRAMLSAPITHTEYRRLLNELRGITDPAMHRRLEARIASAPYAYRTDQLQLLHDSIRVQTVKLAAIQTKAVTDFLSGLIGEAYSRAMFDIQRGVGLAFPFAPMNQRSISAVLNEAWSGRTFSARIWGNTQQLNTVVTDLLTKGLMTGASNERMADELAKRMGVSYRQAERLIRTEMNYYAGQGELESYREAGIERYQYVAVLDGRTSKICADLDGEDFAVADAVVGENMHPMHPYCRSTTCVYLDMDTLSRMERRAKDASGAYITVPASMRYAEWKERYAK